MEKGAGGDKKVALALLIDWVPSPLPELGSRWEGLLCSSPRAALCPSYNHELCVLKQALPINLHKAITILTDRAMINKSH